MKGESVYLGSGAYATKFEGERYVLAANDHDPEKATAYVWLDAMASEKLRKFLTGEIQGDVVEIGQK